MIASHTANWGPENFNDDTFTVNCAVCGVYKVTREALTNGLPSNCGYALTEYVRKAPEPEKGQVVTLTTDVIDEICSKR